MNDKVSINKETITYFEFKSIPDCIICFKLFVTSLDPEYIIKTNRILQYDVEITRSNSDRYINWRYFRKK
jgi:hypothetical protein